MSRAKHKLEKLEAQTGRKTEDIVLPLLNKLGSQKAVARQLNVAESTISLWLRRNGYKPITQWTKKDEQPPPEAA